MPDLPAAVADFLGLGLAAERGKRFQSASDMLADLRALDLEGPGRRPPVDRGQEAAKQGEKPKGKSRGIGLPVTEVVMHAHKDYSLSRRERIIRLDTSEKDGSGKTGRGKKKREER